MEQPIQDIASQMTIYGWWIALLGGRFMLPWDLLEDSLDIVLLVLQELPPSFENVPYRIPL